MRLTPKAIEKIKESTRLKARLALVLNKSGYTIEDGFLKMRITAI
jgi:histidinol phosphatase-like enzyme